MQLVDGDYGIGASTDPSTRQQVRLAKRFYVIRKFLIRGSDCRQEHYALLTKWRPSWVVGQGKCCRHQCGVVGSLVQPLLLCKCGSSTPQIMNHHALVPQPATGL